MIILLVLLPALVLSAGNQSSIDWTKCGMESRCYCLSQEKLNAYKYETSTLENCAKIGLQNQFFTEDTAIFQLQVVGEAANSLGDEPRLMLFSEDIESFGCKFDKKTNSVQLQAHADFAKKYKIKLFETRSRFEPGNVLCAIKMDNVYNYKKYLGQFLKYLTEPPKFGLRLSGATAVDYAFYTGGADFYKEASSASMKCDPFLFKGVSMSPKYHILPVINRDREVLNCENYETDELSYTMRYDKSLEKDVPIKALKCVRDAKTGYSYKIVRETNETDAKTEANKTVEEPLTNPESYSIYCAVNLNETCTQPDCTPEGDLTCPKYNADGKVKGKVATLECDGGKWLINGSFLELDTVCKRDPTLGQNSASFMAPLPSGDASTKGARCFTNYDCWTKSNLDLPVCKDETLCGGIDESNKDVLKCKNKQRQLSIYSAEEKKFYLESSYKCNTTSGKWYNDDVIVPFGSQVGCEDNTTIHVKAHASISDATVNGIIAGIFVFILLLIVAIGLTVYCCIKRKNKRQFKQKKEWLEMKMAERIARTKADFDHVLRASSQNCHLILEGLKMVEMLLDTETEDISVWEEAYKFLMRFQGAIVRIDYKIWHMFNRYLHLQAKTIIDKHGWLTKKRITNKHPNGLIRVVAIRLLSFTLNDPYNHETEELLWLGFRVLGWRGAAQYPHCGVLWSVLLHSRPGSFQRRNDTSFRADFDPHQFIRTLREIASQAKIVMPPEDTIPAFGSLAQQAAFALGGAPSTRYHVLNFKHVVKTTDNHEGGAVQKAYFAGMGESLTRNPVQIMLDACGMWPKPNPALLKDMYAVAPEAEWNSIVQRVIRLFFYYGRSLDAKRLQVRFIANPAEDEFGKLNHEQQQFEAAMEKSKEDLRGWLAARTDREELKKKPVYITDSKVKLDNRIRSERGPEPASQPPSSDPAAAAAPAAIPPPTAATQSSGPPSSN